MTESPPLHASLARCVGLVHAVMPAISPIEAAFRRLWPEARTFNLLDEALPADLERDGHITADMNERIHRLAAQALAEGADGVLFTCSAFGSAIDAAARRLAPPILRPDEAMFTAAMRAGRRIGLLATFDPAIAATRRDFLAVAAQHGVFPELEVICVPEAIAAARRGDVAEHNRLVAQAAPRLGHCDAVMLAHFSTSTALDGVRSVLRCPVFSAPEAAVDLMRRRLCRQPRLASRS
jgi:Asp/Glu/hydantoin racemase